MGDVMTKDLNGAWLALGVAGAVAAMGATLRQGGSRYLSGTNEPQHGEEGTVAGVQVKLVPAKGRMLGRHEVWINGLSRGVPLEDVASLNEQDLTPFLRAPSASHLYHAAHPSRREWILQNGLRPSGTYGAFVWAAVNPAAARRAMYLADNMRNVDIFQISSAGLKLLYEEPIARYWLYSAIAEQLPDVPPRDGEGEPLGSREAYKSLWRRRALGALEKAEDNGYLLDSRRIEGGYVDKKNIQPYELSRLRE
jgi:hypothetical protein